MNFVKIKTMHNAKTQFFVKKYFIVALMLLLIAMVLSFSACLYAPARVPTDLSINGYYLTWGGSQGGDGTAITFVVRREVYVNDERIAASEINTNSSPFNFTAFSHIQGEWLLTVRMRSSGWLPHSGYILSDWSEPVSITVGSLPELDIPAIELQTGTNVSLISWRPSVDARLYQVRILTNNASNHRPVQFISIQETSFNIYGILDLIDRIPPLGISFQVRARYENWVMTEWSNSINVKFETDNFGNLLEGGRASKIHPEVWDNWLI